MRVADRGGDQRDADFLLGALAGLDLGQPVVEQPDDGDLDGSVRAGDAHFVMTFGHAHATTPGARTPGCSKNTCTSSHSTWYSGDLHLLHDARVGRPGDQQMIDGRARGDGTAVAAD